ncbi:EAL domain-containing protein [Noviherbaspirillum pedocola]|nr:EAL domain-containing protein [Noviherbaspirillum pedocola]
MPGVDERLQAYRNAGVQVAIDDFGTGYSSMTYLQKFQIDYLKIDQSFIRDITSNLAHRTITETIIMMAHKLGLKAIAEGIETEEQLSLLKEAGCDYGQGFLFSPPVPLESFEELLAPEAPSGLTLTLYCAVSVLQFFLPRGAMMISNLQSARALIQADLDHARKVLELWSQQVNELERALEQIDSVGESRQALKDQYTGGRNPAPRLMAPASRPTRSGPKPKAEEPPAGTTKKQRAKSQGRSSDSSASSAGDGKAGAVKKAKKLAVRGTARKVEAKYKDLNSDKTWSGRGRRPAWFVGEPEQYLISPGSSQQAASGTLSTVH